MKCFRLPLLLCLVQLWSALPARASVLDVSFLGVIKEQKFDQHGDKIVKLSDSFDQNDEQALRFNLFLDLGDGGSITSATVTTPGGTNLTMTADGDSSYHFSFSTDNLLELNTRHPSGTYTFNIATTHNGNLTIPLTLSGDTYPNVPRVSNYSAAQIINPNGNFTLTWDAFTGGTAGDFIQVSISDEFDNQVYDSGSPGNGLDGTATQVTIPAGTLSAGKQYHAEVMFAKIVQNANSGSTGGVAAYTKLTSFNMTTTGPVMDFNSPNLSYPNPQYSESSVPVKSVIAFTFNEPMDHLVNIAWSGTGLNAANFVYTWSADDYTLYAVYNQAGGLPTNTEISWTLNPIGENTPMQDKAGNPLYFASGSFTTSSSAATSDPDVKEIMLIKNQFSIQTGATPTSVEQYTFEVNGDLRNKNGILNGTVTTPGTAVVRPENNFDGTTFDYEAQYASKTDLDRFFPNGAYSISLDTAHDGTKTVPLTFPADNYPNVPTLSNFSSLQAVNSAQGLTISWSSFSGADNSSSYFIKVNIETDSGEEVFSSPGIGEGGALTGTSTSIVIPANTLSPGRKYWAELVFARIVATDSSTYSGVTFRAVFAKATEFEIQTTGSPIRPALTFTKGNPAQINLTGDKHVSYVLEATEDLQSWHAISYPQGTYSSTTTSFFDADFSFFPRRFYRVREDSSNGSFRLPVTVHGTVYDFDFLEPIAGATVSTTLSGATAVTDSEGNFYLQTGTTLSDFYQSYGITVTKAGYVTSSQNLAWGERVRNQQFYLQQPR
jgi:hypothetical protein